MKTASFLYSLALLCLVQGCSDDGSASTDQDQDSGCGFLCTDDTGNTADTAEDVATDVEADSSSDAVVDTGSTDERAAVAAAVRALCTAQRRHLCRLTSDCESLSEIRAVFEQMGGINTASCTEAIATFLTPECDAIAAGVESGRVTVDRAAVAACMPEVASEDCDTQVVGTLPVQTRCTSGIAGATGLQADGEPCLGHVECAADLRCSQSGGAGDEGQCEVAEGAACSVIEDCPASHFCSGVATSPEGVGGCTARLGEGALCNDPNACAAPFACLHLGETDPATGRPFVAVCAPLTP